MAPFFPMVSPLHWERRRRHIGAAGPGIYRSALSQPHRSNDGTVMPHATKFGHGEAAGGIKADLDKPAANGTTALIDAIVNNHRTRHVSSG